MNFLKISFFAPVASVILLLTVLAPARAQPEAKPKDFRKELSEINLYTATTEDQLNSVSSFGDVYPSDWAYQALKKLVESYGCIAGYPNGTFKENRPISRYEAASLLNSCLDKVSQITDEIRALIRAFGTELSVLKGRVDGIEARVGELEATNFSTTTKLKVDMGWLLSGTRYTAA
jgi:hypothetical protein